MLETRFTLILRPGTDDHEEARQDALDFIKSSQEGWYGGVQLGSEIDVIEVDD